MDNYKRITTQKDQAIHTWEICPPRSKPQTQEEENDPFGDKYSTIYRVDSRDEFDNCQVKEAHKVDIVVCRHWPFRSQMLEIPVCYLLVEFDEKKEYYFLSVSSSDRVDGVCDDFVLRFSITIDSNANTNGI